MWQLWFSVLYTGWYVVLLNYVCKPKLNCNHWDPCAVGCYVYFQFSSVTQSYLTLCDPIDCSMPGLPVRHQLPEFMQIHVHWVGDAIQSSQSLSFPSFPTELWLCSLLFIFSLVLTVSSLWGLLFLSPLSNPSFGSSVQFSCSVMSDSLPPHGLQHGASLSITNSWSLLKLMSIKLVRPSNHLIFCHPLLLLPSIFPSIRVFSIESVICIRWPNYWSFSFSLSPSNEYSGLISFRIDWLDLLAVQRTLKSLLQHHCSNSLNTVQT